MQAGENRYMYYTYYEIRIRVRSVTWKSGLASEALTRVLEHLEQNGQVLQNPHEISVNLAYSKFL